MTWELRKVNEVLARHSTKRACWIEAIERGFVGEFRGNKCLFRGYNITEVNESVKPDENVQFSEEYRND